MSADTFTTEPATNLKPSHATLAQCERQVDEFLASPVSRNEPMLMGSPATATPSITAYSLDVEKVFCNGVLAIMRIASNKLFRFAEPCPFTGLESYFRARFSLSRAQVYRYLNCAAVISDLISAPQHMTCMLRPLPLRQRVAKAVKDLAPCRTARQQLWAAVLAQQPPGLDITSTDVHRVAALLEHEAMDRSRPQAQLPFTTGFAGSARFVSTSLTHARTVPTCSARQVPSAVDYPSPPSEAYHTMDDTDEHGDFAVDALSGACRMAGPRLSSSGDASYEMQSPYPLPLIPASGDDASPLAYPSPDISHVSRQTHCASLVPKSEDAASPLQCLAQVALETATSGDWSMLSVTSASPFTTPIVPSPPETNLNSDWLCQPISSQQFASTAPPPTRVALISSSQSYRLSQAALRGPALGVMSPDLRPKVLRPESPALGQSFASSFDFDRVPASTNQWNCQLPPIQQLIALVDQSTEKIQASSPTRILW